LCNPAFNEIGGLGYTRKSFEVYIAKVLDSDFQKLLRRKDSNNNIFLKVDPRCPEFESTFCTIEQQLNVTFSKLRVDCLQSAVMDLQLHGLALVSR